MRIAGKNHKLILIPAIPIYVKKYIVCNEYREMLFAI